MFASSPFWRFLAALVLAPLLCSGQYGGGYGGTGGYQPPAPVCKKFQCPKGQRPAGRSGRQIWSYGCKDSGINFLSTASFDLNNPLGGMNKGKSVDKCCIERDICKQTCGTTSKECHDLYWTCSKKICKGDQNCEMSAMMGGFQGDAVEDEPKKDPPEEWNYERDKQKRECGGFEKWQKESCVCVAEGEWQAATDTNLKAFYKVYNPEKLDSKGEIKDPAEVWKKWKGKEPQMFQALASKYRQKAVQIKEKPKPAPYTPPPPKSKEEQEKEDKRMADQRAKWDAEDKKREEEKAERERQKQEEREEAERKRVEEEEGETVEL